MVRPRRSDQCIGRYQESNDRMKKAWALQLKHGDFVCVLLANGKHSDWQFSHYTQAGARLFCRVNGCYYSRLINWDKGDNIFRTKADLNIIRLYNVIMKKSRLKLELQKLEDEANAIMQELK